MKSSIKSTKARIERSLRRYIIFALLRERTEFLLFRHELVSNRWRMNQDAYIRFRKPTLSSWLVLFLPPLPSYAQEKVSVSAVHPLYTLMYFKKKNQKIHGTKVSIVLRQKYFCDTDRIIIVSISEKFHSVKNYVKIIAIKQLSADPPMYFIQVWYTYCFV